MRGADGEGGAVEDDGGWEGLKDLRKRRDRERIFERGHKDGERLQARAQQ